MKKEIVTINKKQEEMNNKILEIKNTPEGITSRLDETELMSWKTRWKETPR